MKATQKNVEAIERARTIKDVPWCEEYELMISGMSCVSNADVINPTNLHRYLASALVNLQFWKRDD